MTIDSRHIERTTFTRSTQLDYATRKELEAQCGHPMEQWPLVIAKELADNGTDNCEERRISPEITFAVDIERGTITVRDNGSGLPPATLEAALDYTSRTSSREAYVGPTRGAQGNALKAIIAMPYVVACETGGDAEGLEIEAQGVRHHVQFSIDAVGQAPRIPHETKSVAHC